MLPQQSFPEGKKIFALCTAIIIVIGVIFAYTGLVCGNQSSNASLPDVHFVGDIKTGKGGFVPYREGSHIPANKGDVVLRGHFELTDPNTGSSLGKITEGTVLAFYLNHIGCRIDEGICEEHILDTELDIAGEDMCGTMCIGYTYMGAPEVTITLTNPHALGNPRAMDEFVENLAIYGDAIFEKSMMSRGNPRAILGIIIILISFMILGTALFSARVHFRGVRVLLLAGLAFLCAGIYFVFSSTGIMFRSTIIKFNTRVLGMSMMFYMLCLTYLATGFFTGRAKITANILCSILVPADLLMLAIPMVTSIKFYDMLPLWALVQSVVCIVITCLVAGEFSRGHMELVSALLISSMLSFPADCLATYAGWWQGGVLSSVVFIVAFGISFVMLLKVIPRNINAVMQAKELEAEKNSLKAELAESRIATMISQIQPHFIYNTLGTIEQLCLSNPEAASSLVRNFSLYLRGNFSELNTIKTIRFSQEMNHVKHYTDIEQVRFPDITIQYDLRSVEFMLPALSVQPLVENAIKHGLMGLEEGGTVTISAYETDTHYIVEVTDDGVGFDSGAGYDESKHVGIKNIRGRIEAMCSGTLTVESRESKGTKATLRIPKEADKNDSTGS